MNIIYKGSDPVLRDKVLSVPIDHIHHGFVCDSAIPLIETLLSGIPYDIKGDIFKRINRGEEYHLIHWKVVMDVS